MSTTTEKGELRLTIPGWRPATVNELMSGHWRKGAKLKEQDRKIVSLHARNHGLMTLALGRRRVSMIVTQTGGRPLDPDNLWKSLLDALVKAQLLIDDSQKHCETGTVELRRGKSIETTIIIEDIGPLEGT